jgi:hypothetical protein
MRPLARAKERIMDKSLVIRPGMTAYGNVYIKIEYSHDGRLSLSGVEGPKSNGDCRGSCGQIIDTLEQISDYAPGWGKESVDKLSMFWRMWHLNDMHAGCAHQRADNWTHCPGHYSKPGVDTNRLMADMRDGIALVRGNGEHYYCTDKNIPKTWEHCSGNVKELNTPCPVCGYKYGTAWLKEDVPADVITWLFGLPETDKTPSWV